MAQCRHTALGRTGTIAVHEPGYDPRPDDTHHHGTPIPPPWHPLPATPRRVAIAGRVWWNGPPWTVLRSARHYLYGVWDWGTREDYRFTLDDVCEELWRRAALAARPGEVSWGNCTLAGWLSGAWDIHTSAPLPRNAHVLDYYPRRGWDDERWRQALAHDAARRKRAPGAPPGHTPTHHPEATQ